MVLFLNINDLIKYVFKDVYNENTIITSLNLIMNDPLNEYLKMPHNKHIYNYSHDFIKNISIFLLNNKLIEKSNLCVFLFYMSLEKNKLKEYVTSHIHTPLCFNMYNYNEKNMIENLKNLT